MPGIGVFGGTFNPIHLGHLRAAEEVREAQDLDEMRLVPAAVPPHKSGAVASAADRLCLVELAIAGAPALRATARGSSAPAIRTRVAARQSIRFLVPAAVETYIASHGLYRQEDAPR